MENTFTTGSGATWSKDKPVRTSITGFRACRELEYFPVNHLTGNFEDHKRADGEIFSLVEVKNNFGETAMIGEDFISQ